MPRERGRGVRSCSLIAAFPQKQIPRRAPKPRAALLCVCDRVLFLDVDSPDVMCSCVRRGGYGKSPTRPSRRSFDRRWLRAECCSRRLPALAWLPLWRASCRQHHEVSLVTPHRPRSRTAGRQGRKRVPTRTEVPPSSTLPALWLALQQQVSPPCRGGREEGRDRKSVV